MKKTLPWKHRPDRQGSHCYEHYCEQNPKIVHDTTHPMHICISNWTPHILGQINRFHGHSNQTLATTAPKSEEMLEHLVSRTPTDPKNTTRHEKSNLLPAVFCLQYTVCIVIVFYISSSYAYVLHSFSFMNELSWFSLCYSCTANLWHRDIFENSCINMLSLFLMLGWLLLHFYTKHVA